MARACVFQHFLESGMVPFAAKEAGINQSTQRTILFYPWSRSTIKKVRFEKLSLLSGLLTHTFWCSREKCLKACFGFFFFFSEKKCQIINTLNKPKKEIQWIANELGEVYMIYIMYTSICISILELLQYNLSMCWYYTEYFIACISVEKRDNITHIKRHTKSRIQAKAWVLPHSVTACSD